MTKIKLCGLSRPADIEAANMLRPDFVGFVFAPGSRRRVAPAQAAALKALLAPGIPAAGVFVNEDIDVISGLVSEGVIDAVQLHGDEDAAYIEKLRARTGFDGGADAGSPLGKTCSIYGADVGKPQEKAATSCGANAEYPQGKTAPHGSADAENPQEKSGPHGGAGIGKLPKKSIPSSAGTGYTAKKTAPPAPPLILQAFRIRAPEDVRAAQDSPADLVLLDAGAGDGRMFDWSLLKDFRRPYFLAGGLTPENAAAAVRALHPYGLDVSSGIETDGFKDPEKMTAFVRAVRAEDME